MKILSAILAAALILASPINAQKPKAKATAHSISLTYTQAVPQTKDASGNPITCPNGSTNLAVTLNSLYRSTTTGTEAAPAIQVSTAPVTSFVDAAVTAGLTYFYKVTATNCNGESAMSLESNAAMIPNPQVLPAPGIPTVTSVADSITTPKIYSRTFACPVLAKAANGDTVFYNFYREVTGSNVWTKLNSAPLVSNSAFDNTEAKGALYSVECDYYTLNLGEGPRSHWLTTGATKLAE